MPRERGRRGALRLVRRRGHGRVRRRRRSATKSYAARLAGEAREFRHPRSPLERSINRLLFVLVGVLVPLGVALGWALWRRHTSIHDAVPTTVAAVVTLVPEGLILLTSLTYAVAAIRMARRGALAQQLNAIESLASVDTICLDKTGTLTDAQPAGRAARRRCRRRGERARARARPLRRERAGRATRRSKRSTTHCARRRRRSRAPSVPFSSSRRWSALRARRRRLRARRAGALPARRARGDARTTKRAPARRVVAFGTARGRPRRRARRRSSRPLGLVVLGERLRADARETVEFLQAQGVRVLVLSGDRPETVAAVAADAGVASTGRRSTAATCRRDAAALRRLLARARRDRPHRAARTRSASSRRSRRAAATSRWSATASTTCRR